MRGSHGWERRGAGGDYTRFEPGGKAAEGLAAARKTVDGRWAAQFERKPFGFAFHARGVEPVQVKDFHSAPRREWETLSARYGLQVHQFDGGVELRVAGRDKGSAVGTLLGELGPHAAVAFLGDDLTDEDAFRALAGKGLGVLIRGEFRPTEADLWIRPPVELLEFMERWGRLC